MTSFNTHLRAFIEHNDTHEIRIEHFTYTSGQPHCFAEAMKWCAEYYDRELVKTNETLKAIGNA